MGIDYPLWYMMREEVQCLDEGNGGVVAVGPPIHSTKHACVLKNISLFIFYIQYKDKTNTMSLFTSDTQGSKFHTLASRIK
jgi:hypothetical protein